jgi:steroid delta-isomerase-like uncharacterized protein
MYKYILTISVLVLPLIASACAQAAAPASSPTVAASAEANKSLVRQYYDQVLNNGQFQAMNEFVSPDYKRYLSANAAPLNAEGQTKRVAGLRAAFPDLHFTLDDLIADGDRVAVRGTVRGTHKGVFQGIAPTGKQVAVTAVEIVRIENGKLAEHWGGADNLDLLQQLGAVVSAGPQKQ